MFGWFCFNCCEIVYLNFGCCIGLLFKGFGFVGFLVKISGFDMEVLGFFIVVYVVVENWRDLYYKKSLLLQLDVSMYRNEIVYLFLLNENIG